MRSRQLDTIWAKSLLIDSVPNTRAFNEFETSRYDGFVFDPYNNVVFRTYMIYKKGFYTGCVIVKDGERIGEYMDTTTNIWRFVFLDSSKALVYNWQESKKKQSIILDLKQYKYVRVSRDKWQKGWEKFKKQADLEAEECKIYLKTDLNKERLTEYLEGFGNSVSDSMLYLIIPYNRSCPSCVNDALNFVKLNYHVLRQRNFKVLFVLKKSEIKRAPAFVYDSLFTYFDSTGRYYDMHITRSYNPTLAVIKRGKVSFAKVYNPNALDSMQLRMLTFLGAEF